MGKRLRFFLSHAQIQKIKTTRNPLDAEAQAHAYDIIANGGTLKDIADYYGVTVSSVHRCLYRDLKKYDEAREARTALRIDTMFECIGDMEDGTMDPQVFAQIKDVVKWSASKESKTYSDSKQDDIGGKPLTYEDFLKLQGLDANKGKQDNS